MNTQEVYVTGDEFGNTINVSKNNPEYGYLIVAQETPIFNAGWFKMQSHTATLAGKMSDLEKYNFAVGQVLPGKIYIHESLEAFDNDETKNLKIAGSTGVICTVKGQPIYRKTIYTQDMNQQNIFVEHDNKEEIIAANLKMNKVEKVTNNEQVTEDIFQI